MPKLPITPVFLALATAVAAGTVSAQSVVDRAGITDSTEIWSAWGGQVEIKLQQDILTDIQATVRAGGAQAPTTRLELQIANLGSMAFHAPAGHFAGFVDGSLTVDTGLRIERKGQSVAAGQLVIRPLAGKHFPSLEIVDGNGNRWFTATQIHLYTEPAQERLVMERMDLSLTPELAVRLGAPRLAGQFLGEMALTANLNIPAGAARAVRGDSCADRPKWATQGFPLDVALTGGAGGGAGIGTVQDVGTITDNGDTLELIAPSSSLKNLMGLDGADVPWHEKFTGNFPPHDNDQHPYLVWNLYRVDGAGRMEQIGVSGIKHAFLTINFNCTINCSNSHILWPGCEDVYGVGNNDNPADIGPRHEVNPRTGVFVSTGSFFDPDGDGDQENDSDAPGENRLQVLREDLETENADYLFESWYVIRDDMNIFNSMETRPVTPVNNFGNSWDYDLESGPEGFGNGPAIDEWVDPATDPATGAQNVLVDDQRIGRFKLAVRTQDLGGGMFRYTYMLMNFDVEREIDELLLTSSAEAASDYRFNDVDRDSGNDWPLTEDAGGTRFTAPAGNPIPWGAGYTFSFVTPIAPGNGVAEVNVPGEGPQTVNILVPDQLAEVFLVDGFE